MELPERCDIACAAYASTLIVTMPANGEYWHRQLSVAMWSIQPRQAESRSQGELWKGSRKSGIVPEAKRLLEQLSITSCRQEMPP
jgi:hypothetical protein